MDYKKAYENALERAKDIWAIHKDERPILEYIFYPENFFQINLKEKLKELFPADRRVHRLEAESLLQD